VTYRPRNTSLLVLAASAALLLAALATAAAASAKPTKPVPCWQVLINDWYDGRIDGTYPISCYRDALKHLPSDIDAYSSARDDIKQALQERITQSRERTKKGGGVGAVGGSGPGGGGPTSGPRGSGPSGPSASGHGRDTSASGPIGDVFNAGKPSKADSVPVPLIVLGAVALLLMAAGGAGFLARRLRLRKLQLASVAQPSDGHRRTTS
jgi:hypothetical protein